MTQVIVKYRSIMVFKNIRIFIQTFHTKGLCRREIATYKIYFHIPGLSELKICKKNMIYLFIYIERDTALNIRGHRMYTPCLLHGRNESMANIIIATLHGYMMPSSNGNILRVTGPFCWEFTGHRWIPSQRSVTWSFAVFFDLRLNKRLSK